MSIFKMSLVALFILSLTLIQTVSAQVVVRGPRYNPRPYPRPVPPPHHRPIPAPRPIPGPGYPQGHVICSASDRGWEEHWNGHGSCGSCLQSHGECVETCQEVRELCEVQGTDYAGRITRTYIAVAPDRYSAEMEARRQCEWDRNNRFCTVTSCRPDNRTISSRNCR